MTPSEKTVSKAIYVISAVVAVVSLCFADFHNNSADGAIDVVIGILFVIFPAIPLLFLSIKVFRKLPKTTITLAVAEILVILDLFYEINFGHNNSSTSAVALFFLPFYLLIFNCVLAIIIAAFKK